MQSRPSHYNTRYKHGLTPQQERVVEMIAAGKTNAEIADTLGITLDGVKWHVRELLAKLGLDSREEAADWWRQYRRPAARASRLLQGLAANGAWKVGVSMAAVAGVSAVALLAMVSLRPGRGSSALDGTPRCMPGDINWHAQTQRQGNQTVYQLSVSLRDEQWYDDVLSVVGAGHPVTAPCHLNDDAGFELFNAGEQRLGPSGKPEPPAREPIDGVAGNPATLRVSVILEKGPPVPIAEAEFSNWCADPAKLFIEASIPPIRHGGPPTVSTSLGTEVSALPGCTDRSSPPTLTVRAP